MPSLYIRYPSTNTFQSLVLEGSISGNAVTIKANDNTTSYMLTLPAMQGAASTFLENDGSGNLSWVTVSGGGGGNVTGPVSSVANTIPLYADTSGQLLLDSTLLFSSNTLSLQVATGALQITTLAGATVAGMLVAPGTSSGTASGFGMFKGGSNTNAAGTAGAATLQGGAVNNTTAQAGNTLVSGGAAPAGGKGGPILFFTGAGSIMPKRGQIDALGNWGIGNGTAALSTSATDGFLSITSSAGVPTGTPTIYTGAVPIHWDASGSGLYIYSGAWHQVGNAGTVTSVGLALPSSILTVSISPVTGSGTLTATLATQSANLVWAGPASGAASTPTFRSLGNADVASISALPALALANGKLLIGSSGGLAVAQSMSGDAAISNAGSLLITHVGGLTAGDVASGALLALAATDIDTPNTIMVRAGTVGNTTVQVDNIRGGGTFGNYTTMSPAAGTWAGYDGNIAVSISDHYTLFDKTGNISLDWSERFLEDGAGTTAANWDVGAKLLNDDSGITSMDWGARGLFDPSGNAVLIWEALFLQLLDPSTGNASLDWGIRLLADVDGDGVAEWSANSQLNVNHLGGNSTASFWGAPSTSPGTGAGSGGIASLLSTSSDLAFRLTVTTGTLPVGSGATIASVTFYTPFAAAPTSIMLTPGNALAAALATTSAPFVSAASITTTGFNLVSGTVGLAASGTYIWYGTIIS